MIHVVGNATLDTLIRLDRFPQPGETVVARGADEDLGGKGANQAIVVARCGQSVRLRAALGGDPPGERIRRALANEGVGDGLAIWPGPTDRCVIYVDAEGENTIVSLIEAARAFDPVGDMRGANDLAPGDWLLMQGNLRPEVTRACLSLAREKGARTALNPSPTYEAPEYDWRQVDLAIVNRVEAVALGGASEQGALAGGQEAGVLVWAKDRGGAEDPGPVPAWACEARRRCEGAGVPVEAGQEAPGLLQVGGSEASVEKAAVHPPEQHAACGRRAGHAGPLLQQVAVTAEDRL